MIVRINHIAFPHVYGKLKPSELKIYLHLVTCMDLNNEVKKSKEDLMSELKVKVEKTYYSALKKLVAVKLISKKEGDTDTLIVNKDIIQRLPTAKDVIESQKK